MREARGKWSRASIQSPTTSTRKGKTHGRDSGGLGQFGGCKRNHDAGGCNSASKRALARRPFGVSGSFGVNAHLRDVAERFAREGYHTLAPELFHRTGPGFEGAYNNFEAAMPHVRALKGHDLEADARAAYAWLGENASATETPLACIGFCLGGRMSFLTNSVLPVEAAVSFYGGGIAPNPMGPGLLNRAADLRAPQPFFLGRPRQTHWARAEASGGRGPPQSRQAFRECRVRGCRPWILLRRSLELQPRCRPASLGSNPCLLGFLCGKLMHWRDPLRGLGGSELRFKDLAHRFATTRDQPNAHPQGEK